MMKQCMRGCVQNKPQLPASEGGCIRRLNSGGQCAHLAAVGDNTARIHTQTATTTRTSQPLCISSCVTSARMPRASGPTSWNTVRACGNWKGVPPAAAEGVGRRGGVSGCCQGRGCPNIGARARACAARLLGAAGALTRAIPPPHSGQAANSRQLKGRVQSAPAPLPPPTLRMRRMAASLRSLMTRPRGGSQM